MGQKIDRLAIAAYVRATTLGARMREETRALREDERGISGIVVAVLLILVAVLAVVMLWGSLSGWLGDLWDNITGNGNKIQGGSSFGSGG